MSLELPVVIESRDLQFREHSRHVAGTHSIGNHVLFLDFR